MYLSFLPLSLSSSYSPIPFLPLPPHTSCSLSPPLSPTTPVPPQLVGGPFDLEMNFIIQETESVVCMVELLDKCQATCQAEVWSIFTAVLKKSVRNLQACTDTSLIRLVLERVACADSMIAGTSKGWARGSGCGSRWGGVRSGSWVGGLDVSRQRILVG